MSILMNEKELVIHQIVWGGNYFPILWGKGCRGLITWDKMVYLNNYEPNRVCLVF